MTANQKPEEKFLTHSDVSICSLTNQEADPECNMYVYVRGQSAGGEGSEEESSEEEEEGNGPRRKRSRGAEGSESDEKEEMEIDRQLDQSLETKSKQHNLTTVNVRNIIHVSLSARANT